MKLHGKKIFFMQDLQILACTLSDDVSTIVTPPKFQCWIKLQCLTCITSHWVAHLRHRFQRLIHIQVSNNVTNIIESSNLSVVLKKKNQSCTSVALFVQFWRVLLIAPKSYWKWASPQSLRLSWIIEIVITITDFTNCEHTTGMLENHVTELGLTLTVKWGLYADEL